MSSKIHDNNSSLITAEQVEANLRAVREFGLEQLKADDKGTFYPKIEGASLSFLEGLEKGIPKSRTFSTDLTPTLKATCRSLLLFLENDLFIAFYVEPKEKTILLSLNHFRGAVRNYLMAPKCDEHIHAAIARVAALDTDLATFGPAYNHALSDVLEDPSSPELAKVARSKTKYPSLIKMLSLIDRFVKNYRFSPVFTVHSKKNHTLLCELSISHPSPTPLTTLEQKNDYFSRLKKKV